MSSPRQPDPSPPGGPALLRVDLAGPVPPYEQLRAQLAGLAAAGQLAPGTRLPPVRQLAGDLGLAPGTVARAYRELAAGGVVVTRGRGGTFIASPAAGPAAARQRKLAAAADQFVAAVRALGLCGEAAEAAVRQSVARAQAAPGR